MSRDGGEEYVSSPRIRIRIESLSDLVFGLALSIGSLELIARLPQTPEQLGTNVALFAFSFVIVISIWIGYTRIMAVLPAETRGAFFLNLLLLFCVALEPYLFYVLQSTSDLSLLDWASFGYAIDAGAMFLILSGLIYLLLGEVKRRGMAPHMHPLLLKRFRRAMFAQAIVGAVYSLSALPVFWVLTPIGYLRFDFWYSAFAFFFVGILDRRQSGK